LPPVQRPNHSPAPDFGSRAVPHHHAEVDRAIRHRDLDAHLHVIDRESDAGNAEIKPEVHGEVRSETRQAAASAFDREPDSLLVGEIDKRLERDRGRDG